MVKYIMALFGKDNVQHKVSDTAIEISKLMEENKGNFYYRGFFTEDSWFVGFLDEIEYFVCEEVVVAFAYNFHAYPQGFFATTRVKSSKSKYFGYIPTFEDKLYLGREFLRIRKNK